MNKRLINLLLLIIILIITNSCIFRVKEYIYVDKSGYWNRVLHTDTRYNFKSNGISDGDRFYTRGGGGLSIHENLDTHPIVNASNHNTYGLIYKPVMSQKLSADLFGNDLKYVAIDTNTNPVRGFYFSPTDIGVEFTNYRFLTLGFEYSFGSFNEDYTRFITVITGPNAPLYTSGTNSYLVYVDFIGGGSMPSITRIGYWDSYIPTSVGHFYRGNFYVGTNISNINYLWEISSDNSERILPNPFNSDRGIRAIFTFNDFLFVQLYDGLVTYTSDASVWNEATVITPPLRDWRSIDDYLFIYLYDKVFCIGDVFTDPILYELPVANVAGATITSISKFKDDLVLTTTNGIYYKNFDQVMKDKVIKTSESRGNIFNIGE